MPPHPHDYPSRHTHGDPRDRWDYLAEPGRRIRHDLPGGGWVEHAAGELCPDCGEVP